VGGYPVRVRVNPRRRKIAPQGVNLLSVSVEINIGLIPTPGGAEQYRWGERAV